MRAKDFITVDEAKMNPSSFANAIKEGGDKGVLVGFEFEVCVPESSFDVPVEEKDYAKLLAKEFKETISFYDFFYKNSEYRDGINITTRKFDSLFTVKPEKSASGIHTFTELVKSLTKDQKENAKDLHDYSYSYLIQLMFKVSNIEKVERNIYDYFEIPNPEKLYKFIENTGYYSFYENDEDEDSETPNYRPTAATLKPAVEQAMNAEVTVFNEYHEHSKNTTSWYIEPDGSLEPNGNDGAAEIVSPPLPANQAMDALKNFYAMAKRLNLYTSASNETGLHINVSIPGSLDVLKLAVFLGDQYVLQYFGRENNTYADSIINKLSTDSDDIASMIYKTKKTGRKKSKVLPNQPITTTQIDYKKLKQIINSMTSDHFASISNNGKYISFRHAGGDYLNDYRGVLNVVGRFVQAMIIASDPEMYKQEYLKKLVKLFGSPGAAAESNNIQKIREILTLIKAQGLPVIELSMAKENAHGAINWKNTLIDHVVPYATPYDLRKSFDFVNNVSIIPNNNAAKDILVKKAIGRNLKQHIKEIDVTQFATAYAFPKLDSVALLNSIYRDFTEISNSIKNVVPNTIRNSWGKVVIYLQLKMMPFSDPNVRKIYDSLVQSVKKTTNESLLEAGEQPIYYFAYGMLTDPKNMFNSKLIGKAQLKNFEFKLYQYANVEPSGGNTVYGTLWEINRQTLSYLDKIEGYPNLYDRRTYPVYHDGKKYSAEVYMMTPLTLDFVEGTKPTKDYLRTVGRGYINAGLPTEQLHNALRSMNGIKETVSTGQGGGSAGNNGGQMVGGPTTYEQEYNMFKSKGPRRITAMTYEDVGPETITLTDLYKQEKPDDDEQIWDYGTMVWDTPFEIHKITPRELDWQLCHQYDVEHVEDLFDRMSKKQHKIIDIYMKDPNLSSYIIVTDNGHIVDGNHRSIAAVLAGKPLRYINIGDEEEL